MKIGETKDIGSHGLDGFFLEVAGVAEIATGGILTSNAIGKLALENRDPQTFYREYLRQNPIVAIASLGDFVLVSRSNFRNSRCQMVYTLLNKNGDILMEDLCAGDIGVLGREISRIIPISF